MTTPPPLSPVVRDQAKIDSDHLKLLSIFHFVLAAFSLVGIGFLFLHWFFLHSIIDNPSVWQDAKHAPAPKELFAVFKWFYVFMGTLLVGTGLANVVSALFIRRRKARTFSLVVAGMDCFFFPIGTSLGVFTFVVLLRDSVVATYESQKTAPRP